MKRNNRLVVLIVISATIFSCKKDSATVATNTATCDSTISYAGSISPLVTTYCAVAGCHATGSSYGALTTYIQVYNARTKIYTEVNTGSMPRGTTLSSAQKTKILCWISNGASNN